MLIAVERTPEVEAHFLRFVSKEENGCWLWQGTKNWKGYGYFYTEGENWSAHRFAYCLFVGPLNSELQIDHLCNVRACVASAHLEAVTGAENNARSQSPTALNMRKTHCPSGHPYSADNLSARSTPGRYCKACNRARYHARKTA